MKTEDKVKQLRLGLRAAVERVKSLDALYQLARADGARETERRLRLEREVNDLRREVDRAQRSEATALARLHVARALDSALFDIAASEAEQRDRAVRMLAERRGGAVDMKAPEANGPAR